MPVSKRTLIKLRASDREKEARRLKKNLLQKEREKVKTEKVQQLRAVLHLGMNTSENDVLSATVRYIAEAKLQP